MSIVFSYFHTKHQITHRGLFMVGKIDFYTGSEKRILPEDLGVFTCLNPLWQ